MPARRKLEQSRGFEKALLRLPGHIREAAFEKLELLLQNPVHPSLRSKKMQGTDAIWEMSVTMNYRITFEDDGRIIYLRKIGTHDILLRP